VSTCCCESFAGSEPTEKSSRLAGLGLDVRDVDRRGGELADVDIGGRLQIVVALVGVGVDAREIELDRRLAALDLVGIEARRDDLEPVDVHGDRVGRPRRRVLREDDDVIRLGARVGARYRRRLVGIRLVARNTDGEHGRDDELVLHDGRLLLQA